MKYKNKKLQITCDGGAATGKSTGAKLIAKKYSLKFLSSGMLYRYASYLILKNKPLNQISFLKKEFKKINLNKLKKIDLNTQLISDTLLKLQKLKKYEAYLRFFKFHSLKSTINVLLKEEIYLQKYYLFQM